MDDVRSQINGYLYIAIALTMMGTWISSLLVGRSSGRRSYRFLVGWGVASPAARVGSAALAIVAAGAVIVAFYALLYLAFTVVPGY